MENIGKGLLSAGQGSFLKGREKKKDIDPCGNREKFSHAHFTSEKPQSTKLKTKERESLPRLA